MSYVGGPGRFKKEWYDRVYCQTYSTPISKKFYYIKARTPQGCLFVNKNYGLSDISDAHIFSEQEAYITAQSLNRIDNTCKYEVFGVSAPIDV